MNKPTMFSLFPSISVTAAPLTASRRLLYTTFFSFPDPRSSSPPPGVQHVIDFDKSSIVLAKL